jgi:hypothetical protein
MAFDYAVKIFFIEEKGGAEIFVLTGYLQGCWQSGKAFTASTVQVAKSAPDLRKKRGLSFYGQSPALRLQCKAKYFKGTIPA